MEKYIWIVSEENHGDVSYFDTKEKAIEEIKKIAENMYDDLSIRKINEGKDYMEPVFKDEDGRDFVDFIFARRKKLNKSWVD